MEALEKSTISLQSNVAKNQGGFFPRSRSRAAKRSRDTSGDKNILVTYKALPIRATDWNQKSIEQMNW